MKRLAEEKAVLEKERETRRLQLENMLHQLKTPLTGISPEIRPVLFERYATGSETGGSGSRIRKQAPQLPGK